MTSLFRRLPLVKQPAPDPVNLKDRNGSSSTGAVTRARPTLLTLPPEIQLMISKQLIYPDALSLKHTNRYFYNLVDTGVKLKVDWLVERRRLHLQCPNDRSCDFGSDLMFCRGSMRLLMQRRREHIECDARPGLGCLVYGTSTCTHRRKFRARVRRWLNSRITLHLGTLLLVLVPILFCWAISAETCN
ncbi:hypothetical protein QBC46DRAFT_441285 [Diplogelasinospora grovesii]|uniref:F-box domain-containing protein n=1 Tax=Diplogelasinospora grovesii TaxID=303347 RepID=A0AAN6S344_9PEZI|nr:hypothetical protein QBC46DRAFT_441285 [Diplogelasinospora grovesii]